MDMVERVARAIAAANGDDWGREGEAGLLEGYAPLARAAIEAMREPTETMKGCRVMLLIDRHDGSSSLDDDVVAELWDDMIDAALTPSPPSR